MNKMISAIVPFYQSKTTIEKCLNSLQTQTYSNFEVICVSDGSDDGSIEIVKQFVNSDFRFKLIEQTNGGVSKARNTGFKEATGSHIQFIDSDDYANEKMFEVMLNRMIETDADIVVCNYNHLCMKHYFGDEIVDLNDKLNFLKLAQSTFTIVFPWNKLYKKEVITELFDEEVRFTEDDLFGLSNMVNAKKLAGVSDILYNYYVTPSDAAYEELSCVSRIALADNFWITKETFWYKRASLYEKSYKALRKKLDHELATYVAMARIFDFMIWEIIVFNTIGSIEKGIYLEMQNIFKEDLFIRSLTIKEKHGVIYNEKLSFDNDLIDMFTKIVIQTNDKVLNEELNLRTFDVAILSFVKMFIIVNEKELNDIDILANAYIELKENNTLEAKYVNELFN